MAETRGRRLAVTGKPVLHSLSPAMFASFRQGEPVGGWYTRLVADSAAEARHVAEEIGLDGLNVTAPFKEDMLRLVGRLDGSATQVGAVNTVVWREGATWGSNTDPAGVAAMLQAARRRRAVSSGKAVVLGAGGAARAAVVALRREPFSDIVVLNRTLDRAVALAEEFSVRAGPFPDYGEELSQADVVVACLPGGVPLPDDLKLRPETVVLDGLYTGSALKAIARRRGCTYLDGRNWLVGQGAEAYRIFTARPEESDGSDREEPGQASFAEGLEDGLLSPWPHKVATAPRWVLLIGLMGTGKTSTGRRIAHHLGQPFYDIDQDVEVKAGLSIARIFENQGEAAFRNLEAEVVAEAFQRKEGVISLGGGALQHGPTRRLVRQQGLVVWLYASPSVCAERTAGSTRPLLAQGSAESTLATLLGQRFDAYGQAADLLISTNDRSSEEAAARISYEIKHIRATRPADTMADSEGEK